MWEWGAFPQPSPAVERFASSALRPGVAGVGDRAVSAFPVIGERREGEEGEGSGTREPPLASPSALAFARGATGSAIPSTSATTGTGTDSAPPEPSPTTSTLPDPGFGAGGRLLPSPDDDTLFWVDIEGKQFSFELSLCGPGALSEERDEIGDMSLFAEGKVSFEAFVEDADMLDSENLVIKWGECCRRSR